MKKWIGVEFEVPGEEGTEQKVRLVREASWKNGEDLTNWPSLRSPWLSSSERRERKKERVLVSVSQTQTLFS